MCYVKTGGACISEKFVFSGSEAYASAAAVVAAVAACCCCGKRDVVYKGLLPVCVCVEPCKWKLVMQLLLLLPLLLLP
jgi:hypothetical protein